MTAAVILATISTMRVAIQGEVASFHHAAARQWFGNDSTPIACDTFPEVFGALNRLKADAAVVAIENSLYGAINQVYDLIESHGYPITGEVHLPIHQQLIGTPDSQVTHVYSHPVALAQCEHYLDTHHPNATRIEHSDTAAAVRFIKDAKNPHYAAIASHDAANLYGVPVIAENIESNQANFTRFLVIEPHGTVPADADRTSLVLTTNHEPGALAKVLTVLAQHDINLSKLQSRPIVGKPWHYRFYLVLDSAGDTLHAALADIEHAVDSLTVLGEYRHHTS